MMIDIQAKCPGNITMKAMQGVESRGVEDDISKPILARHLLNNWVQKGALLCSARENQGWTACQTAGADETYQ
jgi:hypothetical protein